MGRKWGNGNSLVGTRQCSTLDSSLLWLHFLFLRPKVVRGGQSQCLVPCACSASFVTNYIFIWGSFETGSKIPSSRQWSLHLSLSELEGCNCGPYTIYFTFLKVNYWFTSLPLIFPWGVFVCFCHINILSISFHFLWVWVPILLHSDLSRKLISVSSCSKFSLESHFFLCLCGIWIGLPDSYFNGAFFLSL